MKISEGPMIRKFAVMRDIPIKEVMFWVNSYVNSPEMFEDAEKTSQERAESIKRYITSIVENSLTERIKKRIREEKDAKN